MEDIKINQEEIKDTGERIIPPSEGEVSIVFSRHKFAYEYVSSFVLNKKVIDIGCGCGYGSKILSEKAELVYGIDYDKDAINYCNSHYRASNLRYFNVDINEEINFNLFFDIAISFQVIEHMQDVDRFIQKIKSIVKKGGKVFITTPNTIVPDKNNPFHVNEMDYKRFTDVISKNFSSFKIVGIGYAKKNWFRSIIEKTPIYYLGKKIKRKSNIKKIATRALNMTTFRIIDKEVEKEAADLLAICDN
ncbi:MAG: class I SAM-dependent methyltransferase [Chitinispirillaceae bacterium]|nr:class I SAM-dependent methyltransferase [Chitinispirillaceae bacterium]